MLVANHEAGLAIVTRLVSIEADAPIHPPVWWVRCEGAGGTVRVIAAGDPDEGAVTLNIAPQGEIRGVAIRKVLSSGTDATGLIGGR